MDKIDPVNRFWELRLEQVRRFASFLSSTDSDAEDVTGEALLAGWERYSSGNDPDRWTTWLNGVVRNLVRKQFRERKCRYFEGGPEPGIEEDPMSGLRREDAWLMMKEAVDRIPPASREVLDLVRRGWSRTAIVRRLDLPPGVVQVRRWRGLRFLRPELPESTTIWRLKNGV